jgi:hypothetical protein
MAAVERSDLTAFEADYARGRRRRVLAELVPVVAYVAALAALTGLRPQVIAVSLLALVLSALALWRGEAVGRAVYPGLLVGVVPFACSFAGGRIGHVCTGDACVSLCMPLCTAGGALAGLLVARAVRREGSTRLAAVMGALALAVGSLGCPHAGTASLSAMGLGLVGPIALARLVALAR